MEKPILSLEGLSKFYTSAKNVVVGLNNVSLSFQRGEFVAITGESGSGKSTLAHVIGGVIPYESGEMYLGGKPTSHFDSRDWEIYRRDNISFISQSYGILLSATVQENVVSALRLSGMEKKDAVREAKAILEKVELWPLRKRRAAKLSSGQKQRLSIARALAKPAPILIADEPTGNLDPENSVKIIELLKDAAKDRLVLLITHDFQEAEDCATRRISLQDGRITMDAQLRPAQEPEPLPPRQKKKKQALSFYASRLQLTGRPVWGSFVLLFFALTAFAVFAFLGTFIVNLDDSSTRVYDKSAFVNGDKTRIVVQRADGEAMTEEDWQTLLGVKYVSSLERFGYLSDINCFYIKDEHYRATYNMVNFGTALDTDYRRVESVELLDYSHFAQTVPMLPEGETFLTAGRLPENIYEVVMAGDESLLDTTITMYLADTKNWSLGFQYTLQVTVVGVTDRGEGVYLHEDVGRMFTREVEEAWLFSTLPLTEEGEADNSLTGDNCRIYQGYVPHTGLGFQWAFTADFTLYAAESHTEDCPNLVQVSEEMFRTVMDSVAPVQVSLTIDNYAYTDRVLSAVQKLGYVALSPYQMGATTYVNSLVNERMQTLIICAAVLLAVIALQVIVLRSLFGSETENYKLLANIGLTCATAKRSVFWQVLLFTALGQGVAFAALWFCNEKGVERIVSIIRYLPPELVAVLSLVHLAAALLGALWVASAVQKKVYPLVKNQDDLKLDEEEEAVL